MHSTRSGSCYVAAITRDVGEACEEFQPVARDVDTRQCYFVSNVEARAAGSLKLGQSVALEIGDSNQAGLAFRPNYFSVPGHPASGLRRVKVLFDKSDGKINPGVAGKIRF